MDQTIIQDYTDFLKIEKQFTPNTLMAYGRGLTLFADYCTDIGVKITAITRENAVQYKEWLMEQIPGISVRTINHYIGIAEGLFVFCRNEEITDRNPFELVERAKPMKVVRDTVTTDQALAIITAVDPESAYFQRDKAILQVLFATGIRVSELTDLIVSDYSPSDESILVRHGKGSKDRIVPIGRHTIALIDEYLATRDKKPDSPLFYNRFKERLTRKSVFMIVKAAAYRAKIRGIRVSPHTLRHSCATALLAGGADLLVIRDILGHSDITTTETYLHNTPVMLKKAMDLHPRAKKITKKRGRPKKNVA